MDNVIANEMDNKNIEIKVERPSIVKPIDVIQDIEYNTCCSKTKSSFLKFASQLFVSLIILIYSLTMVALGRNDSVYYSLITLIIGVYIPTPNVREYQSQ